MFAGLVPVMAATFSATQNRITSISPTCANPGDRVTITGFGFEAKNVRVTVGGVPAQVIHAKGHTEHEDHAGHEDHTHHTVTFIVPASAPYGSTTVELLRGA